MEKEKQRAKKTKRLNPELEDIINEAVGLMKGGLVPTRSVITLAVLKAVKVEIESSHENIKRILECKQVK